jgi:hypothetical protein
MVKWPNEKAENRECPIIRKLFGGLEGFGGVWMPYAALFGGVSSENQ